MKDKIMLLYAVVQRRAGEWTTPLVIFGALTAIMMVPLLLRPGFIFMLDWTPLPRSILPPDWFRNDMLFKLAWWAMDLIVPGGVLQKLFLGAIFFMAGFGMFRFIRAVAMENALLWGAYVGGIFYMFNPFVYSRVLVGQWILVAAYALFPWFFSALLHCIEDPTVRRTFVVALWWTGIAVMNLHAGVFILLPLFFFGLFAIIRARKSAVLWRLLRGYCVFGVIVFLLNSYWMTPFIAGRSSVAEFVTSSIGHTDILSFFTRSDPTYGVLWNTAALYGFWADEDQRYVSQKTLVPYWSYIFFFFAALVLWGAFVACVRRSGFRFRYVHWSLLCMGVLVFWLAVGVSFAPLKPMILWMYDHVPYFRGFREPHKFVSLLAFAYAVFAAIGTNDVIMRADRFCHRYARAVQLVLPALLLLIPLSYSPGMLWGFHGQFRIGSYPKEWFQLERFLNDDPEQFRTLFFPWHMYIYLDFAKNVVYNPIESFFTKGPIAGDNVEFGSIYTQSTRRASRLVEHGILDRKKELTHVGNLLNEINVKYVVLLLDSDFMHYTFIEKMKDLDLVFETKKYKVFRNSVWNKDGDLTNQ